MCLRNPVLQLSSVWEAPFRQKKSQNRCTLYCRVDIAQAEEVPVGPRRSYVPPVYKQNENYDDRLGK
jgi:hypothetical protein